MFNKFFLVIFTFFFIELKDNNNKRQSISLYEITYDVIHTNKYPSGELISSINFKNYCKIVNDSFFWRDCSGFDTEDSCFHYPPNKYFKRDDGIYISTIEEGKKKTILRFSLDPKATVKIDSYFGDKLLILNLTHVKYLREGIIDILGKKRICYIFKMGNFRSFNEGIVQTLYLDKENLIPLRIMRKSYRDGKLTNEVLEDWKVIQITGSF